MGMGIVRRKVILFLRGAVNRELFRHRQHRAESSNARDVG